MLEGFTDNKGLFGEKGSFIKFTDDEKNVIKEATRSAYEYIDEIFIEYMRKHYHIRGFTGVDQFIYQFPPQGQSIEGLDGKTNHIPPDKNDKTFIFTLNQDLFFERTYPNFGVKLSIPGIDNSSEWFADRIKEDLKLPDYCRLPTEDELSCRKDSLSKENFFLIKLHGSYNWVGIDGSSAMIIGRNKEEKIKKEPLLSYYFEIFKNVLSQDQCRLLIVGYSFNDKHINRVISNAVINHELKIYTLSPEPLKELKKKIKKSSEKCEDLINIYNGISGCFPYTEILKGDSGTDQTIKKYFSDIFFDRGK